MGSSNSGQERAVRKQHEYDVAKWEYNWQKMQDNYQYQMDQFDIAQWNQQQSITWKNEQAKNDWVYKEEMRRFDYNNQVAAYNASLDAYEQQMDYNNLAAELTSNDNTRKYNERLTAIGFQHEEMFTKHGFNLTGMRKQLDASLAEKSFKGQEMMIKSLQHEGSLLATGQTGRTAKKNVQAALATYGRSAAALADSVLREKDNYMFGVRKANTEFNLGKRQLQESMKSAGDQYESDQQHVSLQKYSADLAAEARIAPEPQLKPALPKPLDLPVPRAMEPQSPPSWDQYEGLKPIKGAVSGGPSLLTQAAGAASAVAGAVSIASQFGWLGSDDRLKYDITRVGTSPSGIPKYTFRYRMDGEHGPKYMGTSAQDLLAMGREDAVGQTEKDGFYAVDYSKLDVDMEVVTT